MPRNPLIVAADTADPAEAEALAKRLTGIVAMVKVGLTLFVAAGPAATNRVSPTFTKATSPARRFARNSASPGSERSAATISGFGSTSAEPHLPS